MSRLGKKPIIIPEKTEVTVTDSTVLAKGPLGQLSVDMLPGFDLKIEGNEIYMEPKVKNLQNNALWGTYTSLIQNAISGVNTEFEKKLIIEGVGFKAAVNGNKVVLNVGFSHPVELEIPDGITVEIVKESISVKGIDKQKVGHFAAVIRDQKKPEPYKGKGIRYENEVVRRKEGKKSV